MHVSVRGVLAALVACGIALLLPSIVHAAEQPANNILAQYVQTTVTSRNGLPQNTVRSIAQSVDGYLWLATEEGIVRYDGTRTRVFDRTTDANLRDNFIQAVATAPDGSTWVATRSGVNRFRGGQFVSRAPNTDMHLRDISCDRAGTVWVATDTGLFTVSHDGNSLVPFAGVGNAFKVRQITLAVDGSLWLATNAGVIHIAGGDARLFRSNENLPDEDIKVITAAADGSIWLATQTELLHWNGRVLSRLPLDRIAPKTRVTALLVDGSGTLWVGTSHDGLAIVQGDFVSHYTAKEGLPSDAVLTLKLDRDENLWVGFLGGGAVRFHAGLFKTFGYREGLSENMVWLALTARDGSVWTGTTHYGLNRLFPDGRVQKFTAVDGMPSGFIYSLMEDTDGSIWGGTDSGDLFHVQNSRVTVFHNPEHVQDPLHCILRGHGGELILFYHSALGMVHFHNGKFQVESRNIPGQPTAAARAPDGSIWVGTDHGGVTHWENGNITVYGPRQGFRSEHVLSVTVDREGTIWIGNSPGGLTRIRDGRITEFSPENGLFDYTVASVTDDLHGQLWMTTNKGIFKVSKRELTDVAEGRANEVHSTVYGLPDGMRSAECNYDTTPSASLAPNGRLWFATTEGLVSVAPGASTQRSSQPNAVLEGAIVDGVRTSNIASLTTSEGAHDVEFDFTAPDFAAPERLRFRYRLQGFDRDWISAAHRQQGFYTRLPPGKYTLQVQATDGDQWPDSAASMDVLLPPHVWQTLWFRGLAIVLLLLGGFGIYEWRVLALRRSKRILQEQVIARTAELQEAIRRAEYAHHELQELATRDGMTRLWNRRHILDMLSKEANRAEREDLGLCVLMLDVDHFKSVNDSRGHLAGDRVLQAVSNVLIDQTRPYDCAGRYGGEEFLIILCNCSLENGMRRANMIREAIAGCRVEWNEKIIGVTASFGVALHRPGRTIEAVLQEADEALYVAKQTGRNRVCSAPVSGSTSAIAPKNQVNNADNPNRGAAADKAALSSASRSTISGEHLRGLRVPLTQLKSA